MNGLEVSSPKEARAAARLDKRIVIVMTMTGVVVWLVLLVRLLAPAVNALPLV